VDRFAPGILLVVVTGLFLDYGSSKWSWVAGPVSALVLCGLALRAREPAAHTAAPVQAPAPVD